MNPKEIIRKKREGENLSSEEINYFVFNYTKGIIPDYQAAAFLMAIFLNGLSFMETKALTKAMIDSGERLDLSLIESPKIDKHSTGGVGDKISLILLPLVAACGLSVPSFAGRGLGHTGGTIDKLEAIPGFRSDLSKREILDQLKRVHLVITSPTAEICPADKKFYALRDATETVESLPLIAASIMSKKIAEGIDGLVLDIKLGKGAFLKEIKTARRLAKLMLQLGREFRLRTTALLTNMDEPLGWYVGNSLEIKEAIEALKGNTAPDIEELIFALGEEMLILGKIVKKREAARELLGRKWKSGAGLKKFKELIEAQGGEVTVIDDYKKLPQAKYQIAVPSPKDGYIKSIPAGMIGELFVALGGGRKKKEDPIDYSVGFHFLKKRGECIKKGEIWAEIYCPDKVKGEWVKEKLEEIIEITPQPPKKLKLILQKISL
ncbi:MAG: thymidine phosphorylase [candidate division WOR-3 bacterium]